MIPVAHHIINQQTVQRLAIDEALGDRFRLELQRFARYASLEDPIVSKNQQGNRSHQQADAIEEILSAFGAPASVIRIHQGPRVTQFNLKPERINGRLTKISAIQALDNDLTLALNAPVRISTRPGRLVLEIPNPDFEPVALKRVMESEAFRKIHQAGGLPLALGLDMAGTPVAADLTKMPHLLISGATGAGKSVCLNALIASLLITHHPDQLKFLMIDPKQVELVGYSGIRHLVRPVITDMQKAANALTWTVSEMDRRYKLLSSARKRHISTYNQWALANQQPPLAFMVVIIDELADLMIQEIEVEPKIIRLAQMARAVGIHLILATQRPTVDVVTGLIKANIPARIAFAVASGTDSRVILDRKGAESLLGQGDCLYLAPNSSLTRLQGSYASDQELNQIVQRCLVL